MDYNVIKTAAEYIKSKVDFTPSVALVLGSGLGDFADDMDIKCTIDYGEIPGFKSSTVEGHKGGFVLGNVANVPVIAMQGRVHYYEGYDIQDVVLPIRVMGLLNAKTLILTNAAGGIDLSFKPGDFMLICDHITSFVPSPLIGPNINELGTRFPDMSEVYDLKLRSYIKECASGIGIELKEGVYLQCTGPNFETPAEIKMYSLLGASAVGMSTAVEAMAAHHMGMKVAGISCISNMAAGISKNALSHTEVNETTSKISSLFSQLITAVIKNINSLDNC